MEATWMAIDGWIDKEIVVHMYNGMLAIKRNVFESVLMMWMNLESITQSEVSQKEKDKYHIASWETCMQVSKGDPDIKNRLLDSVGEGKGGMI